MEFEGRKRINARLDMAPLIDVVFLLLIFFMLSAHFVTQPGIKIDLPTASTAKLQTEEDIVISITADSVLYLNEEKVSLEDLLEKLKKKMDESQKRVVIVKADEKIDLGLAVRVMDISKQAKAEGLVISTGAGKDEER